MNAFRWWLFKKLSRVGWAICPEPQRTRLYQSMKIDTTVWTAHQMANWHDYTPPAQEDGR